MEEKLLHLGAACLTVFIHCIVCLCDQMIQIDGSFISGRMGLERG